MLKSRPLLPLVSALALGPALLVACAGPQKSPSMVTADQTNVPAAPAVDRGKCKDAGKQVVTSDTNRDQKPDIWKYFHTTEVGGQKVQIITCKQVDLNNDGKVDAVYYYDDRGAQLELEEFDLDFDGRFDQTVYYSGGKRVRKEMDMNFDKRADVWEYYEEEKLVRVERDTNNDGKVDEWQYYEGGKLDRIGYDTSGSGRVDRWDRAPEADEEGGAAEPAAPAPTAPPAAAGAKPAASTAPPPAATSKPAASTGPAAAAAAKPASAKK